MRWRASLVSRLFLAFVVVVLAGWAAAGLTVAVFASIPGVQGRPVQPFVFAVLVLVLGVVWMLRLARAITRPVRQLAEVAEAFGKGRMEARAKPGAAEAAEVEELAQLARAFNEMADRIVFSRRAERELLANLSHELRTPLGRLRMLLGLLDVPDQGARARVREMEAEIEELDGLISDLLTTSRLELGPQNIRREPVDLRSLAERSRRRLSMVAPEREVAVVVAPYTFASGDERLLGRVIDNLLDNAHKYSPRGSGIRVNGRRVSEERVQLSVEDEGTAIPEAEREEIFQAFVRGSGSGELDGHGLGLSLARKVVEAHGGVIRVVQRTLRGNRFELELPAAEGTP